MRVLIPLPLLLLTTPLLAEWGRDFDPRAGRQRLTFVKPGLDVAQAARLIEALKRFRGPQYKPVFLRLLDHEDWHIRHRALLALASYDDPALPARAWKLTAQPQRRLRERAVITCLQLRAQVAGADLARRRSDERDPYVLRCLDALSRRVEPTRLGPATGPRVAYVTSMDGNARRAEGNGSARFGPPAPRWVFPLLGWGDEELADSPLLAFSAADPVHPGHDVGAGLDGAGVYAAAAGVVTLIEHGGARGTRIVIEHHLASRELVHTIYARCAATVFVAPGERVEAGQLLGTIGLSFSNENGGVFAHLHFEVRFGQKRRDPAVFLKRWVAWTEPLISKRVGKQWSQEFLRAQKIQDHTEPGSEAFVDANMIVAELRNVPARAVRRARQFAAGGYPGAAVALLGDAIARGKSIPGISSCRDQLREWEADALFRKALKGEKRIATTAERGEWQALLKKYGDTCLAPRLEERVR